MGRLRDFFVGKKQPDNTDAGSVGSDGSVAEPVILFTSEATNDLISAREALFKAPVNFWSTADKKNIALTAAQKQLQNFILEHLKNGALARDAKLRQQSTEKILDHLIEHWQSTQSQTDDPLLSEPAPQQGYAYNPLPYVGRGIMAVAGVFYTQTPTSAPEPVVSPTEKVVTEAFKANLIVNFGPVIESIKRDQATDVQGLLKNWQARTSPMQTQLPFNMTGNIRAEEKIKLIDQAESLKTLYGETADMYNAAQFKSTQLEGFVANACKHLHDYYGELLILNTDLNPNNMLHWRQESVQNALNHYFEQRTYLYQIYSMGTNEAPMRRAAKMQLMKDYRDYIKDLYARNEEFTTTFGPLAFGYSKWEKIEAAMEQYRTLCELPGDIKPAPIPEKFSLIRGAGEQGRLRALKGRGLFFHHQFKKEAKDPFEPLPIPGAVEAIRPHRSAYR